MFISSRLLALLLVGYALDSVIASPISVLEKTKCPQSSTLCKNHDCCPMTNATCCSDDQHCCPAGFDCDMNAGWCVDKMDPKRKHELVSTSKYSDAKPEVMLATTVITCPDGSTCPLNHFCCEYMYISYGYYSCCPAGTVCCVDSGTPQCCPDGYVCKGAQCIKAC